MSFMELKMNRIWAKHSITAVADRLKKAGRPPVLRAVCAGMDIQRMGKIQQNIAPLKGRYSHARATKARIADLPADLQHLLSEEFERELMAFRAKLESEYAEIKRDRDELADLNERQSAQIESLMMALDGAGAKITEQARRIEQLRNEIAAERESRGRIEQRIRDARQELTKVEHRLEDPCPESGGGA